MMKALLQWILKELGLYHWFKNETFAYDVYFHFKAGRPVMWRRREVAFYRNLVANASGRLLIFDVGANRGVKTAAFLKLGAHVIAVEPDEANLRILARKYHCRLWRRPVTIVGKALSDSVGAETLWIASPGSGLNTLSRKWVKTLDENAGKLGVRVDFPGRREVETTTLALLMESHGVPRYIKIDVEGHEPHVLRGLKHPVPILSFEANLPEFLPEASECVEILSRLSKGGRFNLTPIDTYKGFSLSEWCTGGEIIEFLGTLGEATVEIYWKSGAGAT